MTLKVIHRLQTFTNAIRRTFVQHFTWFHLAVCSHGSSALAELLVYLSDAMNCIWQTIMNDLPFTILCCIHYWFILIITLSTHYNLYTKLHRLQWAGKSHIPVNEIYLWHRSLRNSLHSLKSTSFTRWNWVRSDHLTSVLARWMNSHCWPRHNKRQTTQQSDLRTHWQSLCVTACIGHSVTWSHQSGYRPMAVY